MSGRVSGCAWEGVGEGHSTAQLTVSVCSEVCWVTEASNDHCNCGNHHRIVSVGGESRQFQQGGVGANLLAVISAHIHPIASDDAVPRCHGWGGPGDIGHAPHIARPRDHCYIGGRFTGWTLLCREGGVFSRAPPNAGPRPHRDCVVCEEICTRQQDLTFMHTLQY